MIPIISRALEVIFIYYFSRALDPYKRIKVTKYKFRLRLVKNMLWLFLRGGGAVQDI